LAVASCAICASPAPRCASPRGILGGDEVKQIAADAHDERSVEAPLRAPMAWSTHTSKRPLGHQRSAAIPLPGFVVVHSEIPANLLIHIGPDSAPYSE
jgi:hypothetical protein